ncbi:MAG: hypothetical protein D3926_08270, partial [Desulfobacteraceae bacterium]
PLNDQFNPDTFIESLKPLLIGSPYKIYQIPKIENVKFQRPDIFKRNDTVHEGLHKLKEKFWFLLDLFCSWVYLK